MESVQHRYDLQAASEDTMKMPARYRNPESIDNWRHTRMLDQTTALWGNDRSATWMTVGDGRYGSDAAYLHSHGITVTATSLTSERLKTAAELGYIAAYRAENAESISANADSFDYVLCKEAYHHFPRPPIALYEMLRVARQAVVMIEPLDQVRVLDGLKRLIKRALRGNVSQEFEPSGNYLYRLKVRELEKLMLSMGGEVVAWRGINDFFHRSFVEQKLTKFGFASLVTKLGIRVQDVLAKVGLLGYGLGCVIVFKGTPSDDRLETLKRAGFVVNRLPRNPYVTSALAVRLSADTAAKGSAVVGMALVVAAAGMVFPSSGQAQPAPGPTELRGLPIVGRINAVNGQVIENVHVINESGPCIVVAQGVHDVVVRNSEIGPCGSKSRAIRDYGVYVLPGASNVTIQRNVIRDVSSALGADGARHPIVFDRNFVFNVRGPAWAGQMVQFSNMVNGIGRSRITCNIYDGRIDTPVAGPNYVGDHISIYSSSGTSEDPIEIAYNRIRGAERGGTESGSGMQLGDSKAGGGAKGDFDGGGWIWAHDNTIVRVNGAGIGVAGGSNIVVERNRVENLGEGIVSMTGWPFVAVAFARGSSIVFRNNYGTGRLWAFNHDGRPGNALFRDKARSFEKLTEENNRYGAQAGLTPAIFDEAYRECD